MGSGALVAVEQSHFALAAFILKVKKIIILHSTDKRTIKLRSGKMCYCTKTKCSSLALCFNIANQTNVF